MSKFSKCLEQGNRYEEELKNYIDYDTFETSKHLKNFKDWDVKITKGDEVIYYEVKSELYRPTGNMCIEYENNNKPSGINATTSNFWGHFIIKNGEMILYLIPIEILREDIKNKKYIKDMRGGDGGRSLFYLFKLSFFDKYIVNRK
jgi:hypothetical protein